MYLIRVKFQFGLRNHIHDVILATRNDTIFGSESFKILSLCLFSVNNFGTKFAIRADAYLDEICYFL